MRVRLILVSLNTITVFSVICAVFSIYTIFHMESSRSNRISLVALKCEVYEKDREIYQYGDYWVMSYVVKASTPFQRNQCVNRSSILIHANPADIYAIDEGFLVCDNKYLTMDFAVYLSTPNDLNDTIAAIAYMSNCHPRKEQIRTKINFHFYFHTEILVDMPIPSYIDMIVQLPVDCVKNKPKLQGPHALLNVTEEMQTQIEIVGKNVLRQISFAHLHIPFRPRSVSDDTICYPYFKEWYVYAKYKHRINVMQDEERIVYRRPTLVMANASEAKERKIYENYFPYDTVKWIEDNRTIIFRDVSNIFNEISQHISLFIVYWHAPLLDDRIGISTTQSENLFLLRLFYEHFSTFFLHSAIAFYNPLENELNSTGFLRSQNELHRIDPQILKEYEILFT